MRYRYCYELKHKTRGSSDDEHRTCGKICIFAFLVPKNVNISSSDF